MDVIEISCVEVWRELSNYIDGNVDPELRQRMEEHFKVCDHCTAVLDGTGNVVRLVGDDRSFDLPSGFSDRLKKRLREPGIMYDKDGLLIARAQEMDWQPGQLPGIFSKVLFNDTRRGYTTALVRITAGTHYPPHKHAGVEELYLLEGDLNVEGVSMRPGDYCRGEAGSIHGEIFTNGGCLFMVSSSQHDEILA